MKVSRLLPAASLWLLLGCSVPVAPLRPTLTAWTSVIGHIDSTGTSTSALVVPDTVQAGAWFTVTIATFGSRGCFLPDTTRVEHQAASIEITPFDKARMADRRCLPGMMPSERAVSLRLLEAGRAVVRLHGRGFHGPMVLERTIAVRG